MIHIEKKKYRSIVDLLVLVYVQRITLSRQAGIT
jgi:hypothetical protein